MWKNWCTHVHASRYTLVCVQLYGAFMYTYPSIHLHVSRCMVHSCARILVHTHVCGDVWYTHVHTFMYTSMCVQPYSALMCTHSGTQSHVCRCMVTHPAIHSCVCRCMVHSCAHIQVDTRICADTFDVNCLPCLWFCFGAQSLPFQLYYPASKPQGFTCLCLFRVGITDVHTVSSFPSQNTQFEGMKVSSSCLCTCTIST